MSGPYYCKRCLAEQTVGGQDGDESCATCGGALVGIGDSEVREVFAGELAQRAFQHRRKSILFMELAVILACAIVLFIGLTLAAGLESLAIQWGTKAVTIGLLAYGWTKIPGIYESQFAGPEVGVLRRWAEEFSPPEEEQ